jgi:hypothetical protein
LVAFFARDVRGCGGDVLRAVLLPDLPGQPECDIRRLTVLRRIERDGLARPKDECLALATDPVRETVHVRPAAFRRPLE